MTQPVLLYRVNGVGSQHWRRKICEQYGIGGLNRSGRDRVTETDVNLCSASCTGQFRINHDPGAGVARILAYFFDTDTGRGQTRCRRLVNCGRMSGAAILRGYCIEGALAADSSLDTKLRLGTIQMAAQISLLLENWFEPPRVQGTLTTQQRAFWQRRATVTDAWI